jgi:poly(A) polymerase
MKPKRYPLPFPKRYLDRRAVGIVTTLAKAGFESYLVGGCVRDLLLGLRPKDYDIATAARPNQVRRLFRRSRIIGRRFKIVHVYAGRDVFEISTFRGPPPKHQKGGTLLEDNAFGTAEEDAHRRDFTINGLFLDPKVPEILDWEKGWEGIEKKELLSIGDPEIRFKEDPVRVLRLIKFMRRMNLSAGEKEIKAARSCASLLSKAPDARVLEELFRLMRTGDMEGVWEDLQALKLTLRFLPEFRKWLTQENNAERMAQRFAALDEAVQDGLSPSYSLLLAVLFGPSVEDQSQPKKRTVRVRDQHQIAAAMIRPFQQRARLPRAEVDAAIRILQIQPTLTAAEGPSDPTKRGRRKDWFLGESWFEDALEALRCRLIAEKEDLSGYDLWHERVLSLHQGGR